MINEKIKLCIAKTDGIIHSFKSNGLDFPNIVTVYYDVDGKTYSLEESVKLKSCPITFLGIVIGQKRTPVFDVTSGKIVTVCYSPSNPHYAYILENVGYSNV